MMAFEYCTYSSTIVFSVHNEKEAYERYYYRVIRVTRVLVLEYSTVIMTDYYSTIQRRNVTLWGLGGILAR
jgi:hypothetical protein